MQLLFAVVLGGQIVFARLFFIFLISVKVLF